MPGRLTAPELSRWFPPGGGEELCLAFDNGEAARLIVLPAWFDEANKLRHFTMEVMRRIHARGWAAFLPDLPGCNESSAALASQDLESWRVAASEAARQCGATHCLTIRAGASLAPEGLAGWRYAPIAATAALKALLRARILASKEARVAETSEELIEAGRAEGLELAGYALGPAMIRQMAGGELPEDGGLTDIAQREVGGGGLWLRAEPGFDADQAERLADLVGAPR